MNRSLQEYLRCIINGNDTRCTEWSADVKLFPLAYNSQITTTLVMTPYEMVFNQKPRKPIMFTANSQKNAHLLPKRIRTTRTIHPRRNRNSQTPRVTFDIPQSPSPSTPENPISILSETPTLLSQRSTSSIPSEYLGSTPTSEQIRENPFNPPNQTSRLPYWTTQSFTQGEPNLINDPIDISTDTTTSSSLPETLSLPSTPSISQISPTPFPLIFQITSSLDIENNHQQITL